MSDQAKSKKQIVDAMVLAFSHSELSEVVGTDSLRMVLDFQYREMSEGDEFRLDKLWGLLEEQPGFESRLAVPPMCRFKMWDSKLGLNSRLPDSMSALSPEEIQGHATHCPVTDEQLEAVLQAANSRQDTGGFETTSAPSARKGKSAGERSKPVTKHLHTEKYSVPNSTGGALAGLRTNGLLAGILMCVAIAGFAAVMYFNFRDTPADTVSGPLSDIPVKKAERRGYEVTVMLSDDSWLKKSEKQQEDSLRDAFSNPGMADAKAISVVDTKGNLKVQGFWQRDAATGGNIFQLMPLNLGQ